MATVAAPADGRGAPAPRDVFVALWARALRDGRTRTIGFAWLFAAVSYAEPIAYRHTYPTPAARLAFVHSFATNKAVVLFYGKAYDLLSVGGYAAWRMGGTLAIFAAVFGMLAAVRALRSEEDAGRAEIVLSAVVRRGTAFRASLGAVGGAAALLWLAAFAGLLAGGLPAGGSAYLALAVASMIPVFAGVGALVSQLASTKRVAIELGAGFVALCFVLRVIADTSSGLGWMRWVTPLGWAEELRPFTGARPIVLLAPLATAALLLALAARIAVGRDVGTGLLALRERSKPRLRLLSSTTAQALRDERFGLLIWGVGAGGLGLVIGVVSKSVTSLGISRQLKATLERLGAGSALTPRAYIGFAFISFVLALSLFTVSQIAAARREEADERLETLLALPVSRRGWLGGRLGLAGLTATGMALWVGLLTWLGAVSQGVSLSLAKMLEAGANCLPVALLFLGLAALAYAALPRIGAGVAYGLVLVAYLWQLVGALVGAPKWLVDVTPFAHVGAVPALAFRPQAAAVMVAIGVVASLVAITLFERRDLMGA